MHFKRIFFRKVGKTSNQCGHLCIPIRVLLGCKRLAIVRQTTMADMHCKRKPEALCVRASGGKFIRGRQ